MLESAAVSLAFLHMVQQAAPPVITRSDPFDFTVDSVYDPQVSLTCAGEPVAPVYRDDLQPVPGYRSGALAPMSIDLEFEVDAAGRPLSIRTKSAQSPARQPGALDAQAALAAWRLPPTRRAACVMRVDYAVHPLSSAPQTLAARYLALVATGDQRRSALKATARPGDDCIDRPPAPETLAYPDTQIGEPPPGGRAWTAIRWNVDAEGNPRAVELLGSSGSAALDAEVMRAVGASRWRDGPRRGCVMTNTRYGDVLPAPPRPELPLDPLARCDEALIDQFVPGRLIYPQPFERRQIEGWARTRIDLASWGQVGNLAVIDFQPAQAFAGTAEGFVQQGRGPNGFVAGVRCLQPVNFRIEPEPQVEPLR